MEYYAGGKVAGRAVAPTGGVSQNAYLRKLFNKEYKEMICPGDSRFIGALGASLFLFINKINKERQINHQMIKKGGTADE